MDFGQQEVMFRKHSKCDSWWAPRLPSLRTTSGTYTAFSDNESGFRAAVTAFSSTDKIEFLETAKLEGTLAHKSSYPSYFEYGSVVTERKLIHHQGDCCPHSLVTLAKCLDPDTLL